jgi:hypothetical protein
MEINVNDTQSVERKPKPDWYDLLKFVIPTLIAIAGLFIDNYYSAKRDFNNKRFIRLFYGRRHSERSEAE